MKLRRESDWGPIGTNPTDPPTSKKYFSVPPEKGEEFSSALVLINQSNIPSVMIRFRYHRVAMAADI